MDHIQFMPYHNRHIKFRLLNGTELQGVVVDPMDFENDKPRTLYTFIPTNHMRGWKDAERKGDKDLMKKLEGEIDILEIEAAIHLNY